MILKRLCAAAALFAVAAVPNSFAGEYATLGNYDFSEDFAVDIDEGSGEYQGALIMRKNTGNKGQFWQMHDVGDGFVTLHSDLGLTAMCLTVADDQQLPGGFIVRVDICGEDEPRDYWIMSQAGDGMLIQNAYAGPEKCLSIAREGEFDWLGMMTACENRPSQIWVASPTGRYGPD